MKRSTALLSIFILFSIQTAYGQRPGTGSRPSYEINGTVIEHGTEKPIEYATILILSPNDSSQIDGISTGTDGHFTMKVDKPGPYILQVGFIGFKTYRQKIAFGQQNRTLSVGPIRLHSKTEDLEEVTVKANEHAIEYKIDKKVVHVADQYTAMSGSAVDILENVPSIQVDIEGNVSLRGNSNFTVLIDDRPTVLDANDALQQIPAGMIKDIEIITNPSAKYDPEGTAGIINIITKKRTLEGISGIAHLDVGLDEKYGGDFLLNYRTEHFNFFAGGDYRNHTYPGFNEEEIRTYSGDTTFYLTNDGTHRRGRQSYGGRAGIEWFPNDRNSLRVSGRYGSRSHLGTSENTYREWNSFDTEKITYSNEESGERSGNFTSLNTEYTYKFDGNDHKLDVQVMLFHRDGDEDNLNTLYNSADEIVNSQRSLEGGPAMGTRYRVNYMQPFSDLFNIEAGVQGRTGNSEEWNEMYYFDTLNGEYEIQPLFSHISNYARSIHAGYGLANGEINNFGYQVGFRAEYTFRDIRLQESTEEFKIDRWDFFPTLHFSYQLPNKHQVMASYTRRIDRPRGWYLEPFYTWSDAYNIRRGNPGLQPEYIDSYEIGYQKEFNSNSVSAEVYYRSTENRIERVRGVYENDNNVILHTYENVGTDYSLGSEVMLNLNLTDWWETSLTGNFYNYRVRGELNGQDFDRQSFTWSTRWSNIFNITESTRIQINPSYRSPEVEAQEREEGFLYVHGAIRQSFLENKLNLTLQVRDIFSTGKRESVIDEPYLYNYSLYTHKSPIVMLNVTWRINNYRNGNNRGQDGMNMDMEAGGMEE